MSDSPVERDETRRPGPDTSPAPGSDTTLPLPPPGEESTAVPVPPTGAGADASAEADRAYAERLLRAGALTSRQIEAARRAQASLRKEGFDLPLEGVLLAHGWLEPGERPAARPPALPGAAAGESPIAIVRLGRYRLFHEIGRGGMGRVWKAWDGDLRRIVALKQVLGGADSDSTLRERFLREARLCARLRHPHIVAVHDIGCEAGIDYFACEYVPGRTLAEVLRGPFDRGDALRWMTEVADALAYAHAQGVVHRDVKPGNILIDADGRAVVADFGLAKGLGSTGGRDRPAMTAAGDLLGTPAYMSPEQAVGDGSQAGPSTDQYSWGVILYEILVGRPPFSGTDLRTLLNAIVERDPPPPRSARPDLEPDLEAICLKALEKNPARRYGTMALVAEDLRRFRAGDPVSARVQGPLDRGLRQLKRRWRAGVIVAAAVFVGIAAYSAWAGGERAERIAAHLKDGRDAHREGRWDAARDAFQLALALDPGHAEARDGFARTDAELRRRRDAEAEQHRRAEARAAAAAETLRKSHVVSRALARWNSLAEEVGRLEAIAYDSTRSAAARRAAAASPWEAVAAFRREFGAGDPTADAIAGALTGWARRLAGDEEEGLAAMRAASARDPDLPFGALLEALAHLATILDARQLPNVQSGPEGVFFGPPLPETKAAKSARALIPPLLERARAAAVWGREEADGFAAALEALAAGEAAQWARAETEYDRALGAPSLRVFESGLRWARAHARYLRRRFPEAAGDAEAVAAARPQFAPAHLLAAQARFASALEAERRDEDFLPLIEAVLKRVEPAVALAPEDPGVLAFQAMAFVRRGQARADRGLDARPDWDAAVAAADRCLQQQPAHAFALHTRIRARIGRAYGHAQAGADPAGEFVLAHADADLLARIHPDGALAPGTRGAVRLAQGFLLELGGRDPQEALRAAAADLEEAVRREPDALWAEYHLAQTLAADARSRYHRGIETGDRIDRALNRFDAVVERAGDHIGVRIDRGEAHHLRALIRAAQGGDPCIDLRHAIEDFDAVLRIRPGHPGAFRERGKARILLAEALAQSGDDPVAVWLQVEQEAAARLAEAPRDVEARIARAMARERRADHEEKAGKDAAALRGGVLQDLTEALAIDPDSLQARMCRATHYSARAAAARARGRDGRAELQAALADLDAGLAGNPGSAALHHNRAITRAQRAEAEAEAGGDPRDWWRLAVEGFDAALEREPGLPGRDRRTDALWSWGMAEDGAGGDPRAILERAVREITRTIAENPDHPGWIERRAIALWTLGRAHRSHGADPAPCWEQARTDLEALVPYAPGSVDLHRNRAELREEMGDFAGAAAAYEDALRAAGGKDAALERARDAARRRAGDGR